MGKSAKAKKEKKKDFQKAKLKVGKTKPKASNATDTSFKARSISVLQQSLTASAPSTSAQFSHHLNLLNHNSKSQRLQSLAYLTTSLLTFSNSKITPSSSSSSSSPSSKDSPQPISVILPKILPIIRDESSSVRAQLQKLLAALPTEDIKLNAEQILLWTRLGLTHLSSSIRSSSLDILEWLLNSAGNEVVTCPGGWSKTLRCLAGLLGWDYTETMTVSGLRVSRNTARPGAGSWTSTSLSSNGKAVGDGKGLAKTLAVLSLFLEVGVLPTALERQAESLDVRFACVGFPGWHVHQHLLSKTSNPYGHLNLFGALRDEEGMEYEDRVDRLRYFNDKWRKTFLDRLDRVKKEGGGVGRVAVAVEKIIERTGK